MSLRVKTHVYEEYESDILASGQPCSDPKGLGCTSNGGVTVWVNEVGYISAFCWACKTWYKQEEVLAHSSIAANGVIRSDITHMKASPRSVQQRLTEALNTYPIAGEFRGVSEEVHCHLGVRMSSSPVYGNMEAIYYPYYDQDRDITGLKVRVLPKSMWTLGTSRGSLMYAQPQAQLLPNKGWLVVTEGEMDCGAVVEDLWRSTGRKRFQRVVSLPTGGNIRGMVNNEEFILDHEKIIFLHDPDEAGMLCLEQCLDHYGDRITPYTFGGIVPNVKDPTDVIKHYGYGIIARKVKELICQN